MGDQTMTPDKSAAATPERLSLKWGTLKSWDIQSEKGRELLQRYFDLGAAWAAMQQHDTPEQKAIICELIDVCNAKTIYLDWDGKHVTKEEAKDYVLNYGKRSAVAP